MDMEAAQDDTIVKACVEYHDYRMNNPFILPELLLSLHNGVPWVKKLCFFLTWAE